MPVSIVVGGQYGSEGKGKVALEMVRRDPSITTIVRPGGTNSGHTGYDRQGRRFALRQLPAASIDRNTKVVFPAGSYIEPGILLREIAAVGLSRSQIIIDPKAHVIRPEHIAWETSAKLSESIGSTASGTGAAVISRIGRFAPQLPLGLTAAEHGDLKSFIGDAGAALANALANNERILIEGTQGFGLSLYHADCWPKTTSRDTTAAGFLSETGLSPLAVDDIIMVIRCHPIRVAGDSGPLEKETDWDKITEEAGSPDKLREFTTVTNKIRRVGSFDNELVKRALAVNNPTRLVLNHLDYIDWACRDAIVSDRAQRFVQKLQMSIGRAVDFVGTGEKSLLDVRQALA